MLVDSKVKHRRVLLFEELGCSFPVWLREPPLFDKARSFIDTPRASSATFAFRFNGPFLRVSRASEFLELHNNRTIGAESREFIGAKMPCLGLWPAWWTDQGRSHGLGHAIKNDHALASAEGG